MSSEVATGINILKNGSDPPLKKDEELPEWLWELAQPEKTLAELQRHEFDELTYEEVSGEWEGGGTCLGPGRSTVVHTCRGRSKVRSWGAGSPQAHAPLPPSPAMQQKRWVRLENRATIKANNASKSA